MWSRNALWLGVLTLGVPMASGAASHQAVFKATSEVLRLHIAVRSVSGQLEPRLSQDQFKVLVDKEPAAIVAFSNQPRPITGVVLIDVSRSMAPRMLWAKRAARALVDALQGEDRLRIGSFGAEVALSPHLTSDRDILVRVLSEELWPGGGTPLWSALPLAAESLNHTVAPRSIIVFSDGNAEQSPEARRTAVEYLLRQETIIYAVSREGIGLGLLQRAASESGGGFVQIAREEDLGERMRQVADELRSRYLIGIVAPQGGRRHEIQVLVDGRQVYQVQR